MKHLILLTSICLTNHSLSTYDLEFQAIKEKTWCSCLKRPFLQKMANLFKANIFIETGTCYGETLNSAKPCFKKLYSVEKNKNLYEKAAKKFSNSSKIKVFHNNSPVFLRQILPSIDERILFWLDAHDSEDSTPIVEEIESIKQLCIEPPIILVDDICHFHNSRHYPSVKKLKELLISIGQAYNLDYEFVLLFDAALAFPKSMRISTSPILEAYTKIHLLYEQKNQEKQDFSEAKKTIGLSENKEKELILKMHTFHKNFKTAGIYHFCANLIQSQ